jgi:hypothetical protein
MRKFSDLFHLRKKKPRKSTKWSLTSDKPLGIKDKLKQVIGKRRQLIYSAEAKKNISENKHLIKIFLELFKSNSIEAKTITLKSGKKVLISLKEIKDSISNSYHTNNFYLFSIKSKSETKKYFVKFVKDSLDIKKGFNGINEITALDIIKKIGFNVVPAHFSYVDYNANKSFIFYEFQDKLIDAEKAYKKKIIDGDDVLKIKQKLKRAELKINKELSTYQGLKVHPKNKIYNVYPNKFKDFSALPVFIDPKTKKLYIYDPLLSSYKMSGF